MGGGGGEEDPGVNGGVRLCNARGPSGSGSDDPVPHVDSTGRYRTIQGPYVLCVTGSSGGFTHGPGVR